MLCVDAATVTFDFSLGNRFEPRSLRLFALGAAICLAAIGAILTPSWSGQHLHAGAVSFFAAIWLGVAAAKQNRTWLGVLSAAGSPTIVGIWLTVKALIGDDTATRESTPLTTGLAIMGLLLIAATFLPRIYSTGQVTIDSFSLRTALDGVIIASAAFVLFWFSLDAPNINPKLVTFFTVAALVAGPPIARGAYGVRSDQIRALFAAVLLMGGVLSVVHNATGLAVIGHMLWCIGMAGQAWSLPVSDPQQPNAQRVFEKDNTLPSLLLLGAWGGAIALQSEKAHSLPVALLGIWTVVILATRMLITRVAENTILNQVHKLVYSDPLTGIGNRRALLERLSRGPGWVLTLDLDSFKSINDQFGHEAGDVVLVRFVNRISEVLPKEADFYRIGGDEFAIVTPKNMRNIKGLSREIVMCGSDPHHSQVSVSVGLAPFGEGDSPAGALRGSDIALQEAKRAGKNRAAVLDDEMLQERMRELAIASRLRSGGLDDLFLAYQPLVAMGWQGMPIIGVEALARWNDRELGTVPPGEFVPVAERQGMIPQLGLTVLRQALEQLRVWVNEGRPIQISINVSVLQLRDEQVVAQMERLLAVEPELAKWIIIEVTETVFTDDDRAVNALRQLRSLGLCTALDDFGTGASTLTRLRHLPIDILKIDRSLVMGAGTDESADAILDMVATLGRRMQMVLVAEGLEEAIATRRCAELGYAVGQGFIFSQPVPANVLPDFARLERPAMPRRPLVDKLWIQNGFTPNAANQKPPTPAAQ